MSSSKVKDIALERACECNPWDDPKEIAKSVLLEGLEKSNPAWVKRAIADGADVNAKMDSERIPGASRSQEERTAEKTWPLQLALVADVQSRTEILTDMMQAGANPSKRIFGGSIFSVACTQGALGNAFYMLRDATMPVGLLVGSKEGSIASLELFSRVQNVDFDVPNTIRVMELMQKAFERDVLPKRPDLPAHHLWTHASKTGQSVLKIACEVSKAAPVLKWLLDAPGVRVIDFVKEKDASVTSFLLSAIESGSLDAVKTLVSHGARLDIDDRFGKPLMSAVAKLSNEVIGIDSSSTPQVRENRQGILKFLTAVHAARKAERSIDEAVSLATASQDRRAP